MKHRIISSEELQESWSPRDHVDRRDAPRWFGLRWRNPRTGDEFTTRYHYTGTGNQAAHSFPGWRSRCIAAGKAEGFRYLGIGDPDDKRMEG